MKALAQKLAVETAILRSLEESVSKQQIIVEHLRDQVMDQMDSLGITAFTFDGGRFNITASDKPTVVDWEQLYSFILKNEALDLLQRRLTESAAKDRIEMGEEIGGIVIVPKKTLRVTLKKG